MSNKTKIITEWDLTQLYKSPDDPQIEKDLLYAEKAYNAFANKYKKSIDYLKNEATLEKALVNYEKLLDIPTSKPYFFLHLSIDKDSSNEKVRAKLNLVLQRLQKISNLIVFFEINISKIDSKLQSKLLTSKKLSHFHYYLKKIFNASKFILSEPEEKILSLKYLPSHKLWVSTTEKTINKQIVIHKGRETPIAEAQSIIKDLPSQKERIELHNKAIEKYYAISDLAESELNAIVTNKKINDELRGHTEPFDSTILIYENDRKSVLNLVKTVTDNFHLPAKFYKIKARMLKLKKLTYADRAASVGKTQKKVTFEESQKILSELFTRIDPKFGDILNEYLNKGQIDAYPRVGKTSGAYCSHDHGSPTFVLLNHTNSFESLATFAHEMGHAIHTEFSKSQSPLYEYYSMSTAEVASTLFEYFLFYDQFEKLSKEEQVIALHNKIQDDVATIFRQIACFNFEVEMHNTIREKGNMSKEDLAACMNKHMISYLGSIFELTEKDGYFFVSWSHIRNFFYVYSYGFGQLASKVLYKKYSEDKTYIEKIKKFLSAGGSMSPEDIFKSIGVDVTKPDFFQAGIQTIEDDIKLLEKLVNKR